MFVWNLCNGWLEEAIEVELLVGPHGSKKPNKALFSPRYYVYWLGTIGGGWPWWLLLSLG